MLPDVIQSLTESHAFIITIARLRERAERTQAALKSAGIGASINECMDGRIAGLETKWTYELDQPGAGYRIGHDPVAVCMGHYMTWHAAHLMNRSPVTIFEDDAEMIPDWRLRLEEACEFLPPDWDIVFLGSCCTSIESAELIGGGLYKVQSILCVHAYTVSQKGLPILLKHCQQIWAPVDIAVSVRALPHMKAYAILPRIAEQKGTQLDP